MPDDDPYDGGNGLMRLYVGCKGIAAAVGQCVNGGHCYVVWLPDGTNVLEHAMPGGLAAAQRAADAALVARGEVLAEEKTR